MKRTTQLSLIVGLSVVTFVLGVALAQFRDRFHRNQPTAWQTLLSFENQDLGNLKPEGTRVLKNAIDALTGVPEPKSLPYEPRLFRTMSNATGETRYILVEERPMVSIPSESRLRVHVFDTAGQLLTAADFSAGWRTVLTAMNIRKNYFFNRDSLVVHGEYCFGGSPSSQHYVLVGSSVQLAYLETNGEFDRNDYQNSNLTIGPLLSQRTAEDWETALNSNDTAEVTSALIWLGGLHWNGQAPPYDEDRLEAEKVSRLFARAGVKKRLNDLVKSQDPWVSIPAKRVLDPNGI
jgi:hypothetical protein